MIRSTDISCVKIHKWGEGMQGKIGTMPESVVKYVSMGTKFVNIALFLCSICYAVLFRIYEADVMFYYCCINMILLLFSFEMLRRKKTKIYILMIFSGIFIFMVLAVIYLGWEFGFQQYCIGFVASLLFTGFYMSGDKKITKRTIAIVAFNVLLYMALRMWTYEYPCIYKIDNDILVRGFYFINSFVGFAFLISYSCIYLSTLSRLENALVEMANMDPLTGISNRRRMQQMLQSAIDEYEKQEFQTVIAMLDVDYFKKVNDTYGHDAGDEVLVMLAQILRGKHEENEGFHVSRWGGEEFLVFYERHQKNREDVIQEFEDLREQIQETVVKYNDNEIRITVTIGLAFYEKGETIHSLIKEADNNLYSGKENGRNRVVS